MKDKLNEIYLKIANKMIDMIPTEWSKIIFLNEIDTDDRIVKIVFDFQEKGSELWLSCFNIPEEFDVTQETYDALYAELKDHLYEMCTFFKDNGLGLWQDFKLTLDIHTMKLYDSYRFDPDRADDALQAIKTLDLFDADDETFEEIEKAIHDYYGNKHHSIH